MRKTVVAPLAVVGFGAALALGFAVAALGSSSSVSGQVSTSETTTAPTSTSEENTTTKFVSKLGARAEVPKPSGVSSGAGGTFALTLSDKGSYSVTWKLTFSKLTGKAIAAHIHRGKPGKAGPVLLALCGPCKSGQTGKAPLSEAAGNAIKSGSAYVNVHTAKNQGGEIRGQIAKAH